MKIGRGKLLLAYMLLLGAGSAGAISQVPLLGGQTAIAPNLMFTLDDSGSMEYECLPDILCEGGVGGAVRVGALPWAFTSFKSGAARYDSLVGRRLRSPAINPLAYDPAITYRPWLKADGTRYPAYPATATYFDARDTTTAINLTVSQTIRVTWCTDTSTCDFGPSNQTVTPATYYKLNAGAPGTAVGNFTAVVIPSTTDFGTKSATRTDCAGASCTKAEELQNFSNWFTYASSRLKVAIGGTSEAFSSVSESYRVGYGTINTMAQSIDGVSTNTVALGVRPFTSESRTAFYSKLQSAQTSTLGTPLRRALDDVGQYFSRTDNKGPWGGTPGTNDTTAHSSCRRSFHLLMTDGGWNSSPAPTAGAAGNADNTAGPAITGPNGQSYTYSPKPPYAGSASGTLADVAMYYWNRDLRPDLANDLVAGTIDPNDPDSAWNTNPAFWQHLVNYTIAFGVSGNRSNPADKAGLASGALGWGTPTVDGDAPNIDDLWHAAINSHGKSISARDPAQYKDGVTSILSDIDRANSEATQAGVTVSGRTADAGTRKFVPVYKSKDWSGDVKAYDLDQTEPAWKASSVVPAAAARNIHTYGNATTKGIPFTKASLQGLLNGLLNIVGSILNPVVSGLLDTTLTTSVQTLLDRPDADDLIGYLRGDRSKEGVGKAYRARDAESLVGDIVNSTPLFVKGLVDSQYDFLPATQSGQGTYLSFLNRKKNRPGLIFAGANDGMLHAFREADGVEAFAFVPSTVLGGISALASKQYTHKYLVDGPTAEFDIYDATSSDWRNIVVGSGGAGAKNLFAVNVPVANTATPPATATMGASDILWEVNSSMDDFAELGYMPQRAEAGTMRNGAWVVIAGNGYESKSGKAQLYVIDALTGTKVAVLDTGVGSTAAKNGLGAVRAVRDTQQRIVAVYAGDLRGNLWKFDFSSTTPSNWQVAFGGSIAARNPLFKAVNAQGAAEPITAAPTLIRHPKSGVMVMFGTGKLFDEADPTSTAQSSLYGIWDLVDVGADSSDASKRLTSADALVTQTISTLTINGSASAKYYAVSSNLVDYGTTVGKRGWRLRLTIQDGQRLVYDPNVAKSRVIFDSLVPVASGSICSKAAAKTYTFVLDPFTGGAALDGPTFDTNSDHLFNSSDVMSAAVIATDGAGSKAIVDLGGRNIGSVGTDPVATPIQAGANSVTRSWNQIVNVPAR